MSDDSMITVRDQMSILTASITNLGKKQKEETKGIMDMMTVLTANITEQFSELRKEIAHIKHNNSVSANFHPYQQLMSPHSQPTAITTRAQYEQGQVFSPLQSIQGNSDTLALPTEAPYPRLQNNPNTP